MTNTLDTQVRLQDAALRAMNGDFVSPDEMRAIIDDIRRDRNAGADAARRATRDARRASKPTEHFDLDALFGAKT